MNVISPKIEMNVRLTAATVAAGLTGAGTLYRIQPNTPSLNFPGSTNGGLRLRKRASIFKKMNIDKEQKRQLIHNCLR